MTVLGIIGWLVVLVGALVAATLVGGLTARLFIRATSEEDPVPEQGNGPTDEPAADSAPASGGERSPERRSR